MALEKTDNEKWIQALDVMLEEITLRHAHHFKRAIFHKMRDNKLGVTQVFLTASTGIAAFGSLLPLPEMPFKILVAILATLTALITGLRQHFQSGQKAISHNGAVARCAEMSRTLAIAKHLPPSSRAQLRNRLNKYQEQLSLTLAENSNSNLTDAPPPSSPRSEMAVLPRPMLQANGGLSDAVWLGEQLDQAIRSEEASPSQNK